MYKILDSNNIKRLSDNASIPNDERNTDYTNYLLWVAEGNTPEPADVYVPTVEQLKADKQSEIDTIEASQYMTRGEREGWLAMIEAQATAKSVPLELLYAANPFYKKLKDVDAAVAALRAELKAIV